MQSLSSFPASPSVYGAVEIIEGLAQTRQGLRLLEERIEEELYQLAQRKVWYPIYEYQKTVRDQGQTMPPINCCQQEAFQLQELDKKGRTKKFKKATAVDTRYGRIGNYIHYLGSDPNWTLLSEHSVYKQALRRAARSQKDLERLKVLKPMLRQVRSRLAALDKDEEELSCLLASAASVLR